jgi:hypothetical protein
LLHSGTLLWEELGYKKSGMRLYEERCFKMESTSSTSSFIFPYTIVGIFLFLLSYKVAKEEEDNEQLLFVVFCFPYKGVVFFFCAPK